VNATDECERMVLTLAPQWLECCLDRQLSLTAWDARVESERRAPGTTEKKRSMLRLLYVVTLFIATVVPTHAQTWPDKPVKLVVPYPPGGGTDTLARIVADRLRDTFGQAFIVENRPGAGGMLGASAVAKSQPDGYTVLVSSAAEIVVNQSVYKRVSYDPIKDFAPVTLMAWTPIIIVAHPDLKIASPTELIAPAKTSKETSATPRLRPVAPTTSPSSTSRRSPVSMSNTWPIEAPDPRCKMPWRARYQSLWPAFRP
jgi:Tripartite tricarboxylate transporter family receptor